MTMKFTKLHFLLMIITLVFFVIIGRAYAQVAPSSFVTNIKINKNEHFITDQVVQNTTFSSITFVIGKTVGFAVQVNITNCVACDGDIALLGSIDGVNFTIIPGCEATYTADGTILFNVPITYFPYLRFDAEETTGSATTFNVWTSVKEDISG